MEYMDHLLPFHLMMSTLYYFAVRSVLSSNHSLFQEKLGDLRCGGNDQTLVSMFADNVTAVSPGLGPSLSSKYRAC